MQPELVQEIGNRITAYTGKEVGAIRTEPIRGGSINQAFRVRTRDRSFFCKMNNATKFPQLFEKERKGLATIAAQKVIKTPEVVDSFLFDEQQILLLEWIESKTPRKVFWEDFGRQLATLHQCSATVYGWEESNYMGSVVQSNQPMKDWKEFFARQRLEPLVRQCADKQLLAQKHKTAFTRLYKELDHLFDHEAPALLHGDLWSGNFMCAEGAIPVLIDPAVYYGHRSMDLAMTTLFGGFDQAFYGAYNERFPLPVQYKEQWPVCNLYPLLIHLLLFGAGYLLQIENVLLSYSR
jgi:protein-ribulosamine 3-kinase